MSDNEFSDNEIDVESAASPSLSGNAPIHDSKRQARAQHNALERRRRDNIKDMYTSLKDEIPNFSNDRASRAQILKKTIEQIQDSNAEVEELNRELKQIEETNQKLRAQIQEKQASTDTPQSNTPSGSQ
ncbi:helix-loop-helix DNA-binding domain-containing protein [Ditylenchus destructor]|uniref:Helix-loop-helix DNA-binding domain-containing protein n=1 Tax=Ditylenchus destructor TaxID=166010 RepID=A0AAD4NCC8_9BILA|nr:helix-loop-helix DNA-binding domain-containing protein [Ditylenchus destructor]